MAPSSGDIYKNYFNDSTLSDLTILLSDRKVYVHRIILCRRSKYFNKLILNGIKVSEKIIALLSDTNSPFFQESSLKEIPLHGDDPVVMMAMFRYIYDLDYDTLRKDYTTIWQFLANVYIAADKYQVEGLGRDVTESMKYMLCDENMVDIESSGAEDFLAAVRIVFDNTTNQDGIGRPAMVDFCVYCINDLIELPEFKTLLNECENLGASILAHERLSLMLEGDWGCLGRVSHRGVIPRCLFCANVYSPSEIRKHREKSDWVCSNCLEKADPVCTEGHAPTSCKWFWYE